VTLNVNNDDDEDNTKYQNPHEIIDISTNTSIGPSSISIDFTNGASRETTA